VLPIVVIVVALAALGIVVWLLLRRRRPAPDRELVLEPDAHANAVLVGIGTASGSTDPASPFDPESPDVNIFRVVLSERDEIDLGYNFFPNGTVVAWRVMKRGAPLATGEFTAEGGGSAQHFLTIPLGVALERDGDPVEILFSWAINEMPFTYLVRREPARMT
jgi:hypothetical protein